MAGSKGDGQSLAGPDDRSPMIIKGKRTKRQRTPSPHCGEGTTTASSSSMAAGGGGGDYDSSPSSSSGMTVLGSTEEEEDLAYCLILLAQGPVRQTGDNVDAELGRGEHFRSNKRFPEVSVTVGAATRAVSYVFECKTCCRTFPSFQALGGHRASHKKPRAAEDTKKSPSEPSSDTDEEVRQFRKITISPPASPVPNLQKPIKPLQAIKPKIHECSICRSEFSSGQALGGHMRRHRAAAAPTTSSGHVDSSVVREDTSRGAILSLDLNLPAPEDDRKFQLAAAPAQKPILFSAPALVDCHY